MMKCLNLLRASIYFSGRKPEGERLLRVPGACYEHGGPEQSVCAQCSPGVQGVDHYVAR